jgi:hypothetical protein
MSESRIEKNIAILLFGISYDDNYINGKVRKHYLVDARHYLKNFKEKIISYFKNKGYNIDIFLSTNQSIIKDDLLKIYNPVSWHFDIMNIGRNKKIKIGLEQIINHQNKDKDNYYDLILVTRFDIFFNHDFKDSYFDFNKLNLVSILEKPHLIDDNFYLFSNKYLLKLYEIFCDCKDNYKEEAHNLKNVFDKNFEINYIQNQNTIVENLTFFKLRYYYDIDFIMNNDYKFSNNVYYFSKNKSSKIMIDDHEDVIYFSKIEQKMIDFAWIGFNLDGPAKYNLTFEIYSDKELNNFDFIKIHNPIQFLKNDRDFLLINNWTKIKINFDVKSKNDLLCFIFDRFNGLINVKFKNIKFKKTHT